MIGNQAPSDHPDIHGPVELRCKSCNEPLLVYAYGQTSTVICSKCSSLNRLRNGKVANVHEPLGRSVNSLFEIGSKANFFGVEYRLIGFGIYKEANTSERWNEYILFNPFFGYRWLSVYSGHWIFVEGISVFPTEVDSLNYSFQGNTFKKFAEYRSMFVNGLGEFPEDVLEENAEVEEYIFPPHGLICQSNGDEFFWMKSTYLTSDEVADAFGFVGSMPTTSGIGATQPLQTLFGLPVVRKFMVAFFIAVFLFGIISILSSRNEVVFEGIFKVEKTVTTPSFDVLNGGLDNLEIVTSAAMVNSWFYVDFVLVNETTGDNYYFYTEHEKYSGVTDGESWSEGGNYANVVLSSIPEGKYHLEMEPSTNLTSPPDFQVLVLRDVRVFSNMIIILVLGLGVPFAGMWINLMKERRRWNNSDFNPNAE